MAFNNNIGSSGQILSATTITIAGATILPRSGTVTASVLAYVAIACGVIVLASFAISRIIRFFQQ